MCMCYVEQMHVHDCQCMNMTESIAQLKDIDHARSYDTKNTPVHFAATVSQVSRSSLVGRSRSAPTLLSPPEGNFLILC